MNLFKGMAIFIGWLTSSLAGIAAILYACGYLITRVQLNLLGLFGLFEYSNEHYLMEGAKFPINMVTILILPFIPDVVLWGYIIFMLLPFIILVLIFCHQRIETFRRLPKVHESIIEKLAKHPAEIWEVAIFLALLSILIFHNTSYLNDFANVLDVSNLLYIDIDQMKSEGCEGSKIINCLVAGDTENLHKHFRKLFISVIEAALLLFLAWKTTSTWRVRFWLVSPFLIIFTMYTIYLPMVYSVLARPTKYAVVTLNSENKMLKNAVGTLHLLNKTDQEFVLWDSLTKRVLWIPTEEVKAAKVKEIKSLFGGKNNSSDQKRRAH